MKRLNSRDDQNHVASLDNFPELWTEILRRLPQADRLRHVPLVNRVLSEACRDPSLWPELRVWHAAFSTEARWRGFLRWLAARGSGLQTLKFVSHWVDVLDEAVWEERTQELIALLAAAAPQLRSLEHRYPDLAPANPASALPAELGLLSQLTSLSLGVGAAPVTTAQVDAMVQTLPLLQRLELDGGKSPAALSDGLPVSIATSCSQLRVLAISHGLLGAVPPELGQLERLTWLGLTNTGVTGLPDSISRLSALQVLNLSHNRGIALPPALGQLPALTRLTLTDIGATELPDNISQLSALQELDLTLNYEAVLPPGLTACRKLTCLAFPGNSSSPVLGTLLSLRHLSLIQGDEDAPLQPHWTQLTGLTGLHLTCYGAAGVPAGLASMSGLRDLIYVGHGADDLPPGPYLCGLTSLRVNGSQIDMPIRSIDW